jgi:class 3 adenylate cyclase
MLERPDEGRLPDVRVSDAERNVVIDVLREHTGSGLLTLDEFSDRVELVFQAKTRGELEVVTRDLPVTTPYQRATVAAPSTTRRKITRWAVAIMSGHTPRGRFRLADRTNAIAIMGGCELDLRNAEIEGPEVEINCLAIMGGVDIIVPEGLAVDFSGIPLLGGTDCKIADVPIIPGSPRIIVRGVAIMGGVTVKSRKQPEEEKALRAQRRAERRERRLERGVPQATRAHVERKMERQAERMEERLRRHGVDPAILDEVLEQVRERVGEALGGATGSAPRARGARPARSAQSARPPSRSIERVAEAVEREWPEMRARAAPDGTVTIMFSDIEAYTEMTERLGDNGAQQVLRRHNELVRKSIAEHGGFEVKSQGDGFMIAFGGASRALRCAVSIQQALDDYNDEHDHAEQIRVRMGLHTGEAIKEADDFLGRCVILASRIANQAEGGEVLVSSVLRELTSATGEFQFGPPREVELKGVSQPQMVSALVWD